MSLKLHYQQFGNPNGITLILLHGLFGSGRNLQTLAKQFSEYYGIFLPDLRNHGRSPHHEKMDYQSMAEDIAYFIKTMEIKQPVLIGHSMGGKVSMVNVLKEPSLARAIIVLDIAPINYTIDYHPLINTLISLKPEQFKSRTEIDQILEKNYRNPLFRQFLLQNLVRKNDKLQWRLNLAAIKEHIEEIKSFPALEGRHFNQPALFLSGEYSDYILPEHSSNIKSYFPNAVIKPVAKAGHWLQTDQALTVTHEIKKFLDTLENT